MKKVLFAMAIAGMFGFAACNNTKPEETIDSTIEMTEENVENAVEEIVDSAVETVAEEATEVVAQ